MAASSVYKCFCLIVAIFCSYAHCKLYPINPFRNEDLDTSMFPNERLSLDDCHLRYYKYGNQGLVAPAFGEPAYLKEFAHMAAIGWTQPNGSVNWKCGGSLVWDNYVLTAAHCITDNGIAPDVARFGDINIFSDEDDQYAQQLRIVEIFRHPEHRFSATYNDIALLKLEANVTLHPTVAPACLWEDDDVRFPTLEATGWGDTGFAQERTPSLLKVTLRPITNSVCNETYGTVNRKLREGIKDHQICAGDERMDTCPGDSGGPLQVRLLHNGKMSPFLVGVTSFGTACGSSTPGVYTRVSSFSSWIKQTIRSQESNVFDWHLDQITCALRYAHLREYEDDIIVSRSEGFITLDSTKAHMTFAGKELSHVVKIRWNNWRIRRNNCSGTLIADDIVLTLAECAAHTGISPNYIELDGNERIDIAEIIVHPAYREQSLYNNLAIIKLKSRVKFSANRTPACIWHSQSIPSPQLQVAGVGRIDINEMNRGRAFDFVFSPMERYLLPRASVNTDRNCTIPKEFRSRLTRGVADEHLCVGNQPFLVPESCRLIYGAPMQLPMYRNDRYYTYAYGLNSFGRDCGFGEAAVSTRLFSHVDWMKTVIIPNIRSGSAVHFINPDWKENDSCEYDYTEDSPAICTHYQKCPKVWDDFNANRIVHFCSSNVVVCCPTWFVQKEPSQNQNNELETCGSLYARFHPTRNAVFQKSTAPAPHMVTLAGASAGHRCFGSLITRRTVITAASCVAAIQPKQALLADGSSASIQKTIAHENYDGARLTNDIALVHLDRSITPTSAIFPTCVWTNLTHTPLHLRLYQGTTDSDDRPQMVPMYNADCQRDYKRKISPHQMCADQLDLNPSSSCYTVGDQLMWFKPTEQPGSSITTMTPHLVGFYSYGEQCTSGIPGVFTRISYYVNWIRENI